ncbi:MAG: SDR family oxidoreductase [Desulfobacteraceae bacterium]|nr:SDR family oxidoreductase [Desulfobacteraceae bacterium]MBC2755872.1 SDR family oxidoreductase [Desulfobacteraceae bacterium]MBC2763961.1 SDR family oxidoreductase [ANME-2 cluster archaeon]
MARPTALITGASAGIGRSLADVFAQNQHDVILIARQKKMLAEVAEEIRKKWKVKAHIFSHDLIPSDAPQQLFSKINDKNLKVDVLVNNAGMIHVEPFHQTNLDLLQRIVYLNIASLMTLTHLFLPSMIKRKSGKILNVASIASFMPTPTFAVYGASKAFVLSFSEALGQELKDTGVTVTCLCPGITETDMLTRAGSLEDYIPGFMRLDADTVAQEGFKACMKGKGVHVDSLTNKTLIQMVKYQPRWLVRNAGGFLTRFIQSIESKRLKDK